MAVLEQLERRSALLIERDDFAIEHEVASDSCSASTTSGKRSFSTFSLRNTRVTSEPRFTAMQR
jgi:hypothetical protein